MASDSICKAIYANVIDNKAIAIAGIDEHTTLRLLGATMTTNVNLTREYQSERIIILYPNKGEEGVIAIVINAFDGWTGGKHNHPRGKRISVFLKVSWTGEGDDIKPYVELDTPWFTADRIGAITTDSYAEAIEVAFKGRRFSSLNLSRSHRERDTERGTSYGLAGNLLCRYLWGTASVADVLHVAVQTKVEPLATKRMEQMTNEVRVLSSKVRHLIQEVETLEDYSLGTIVSMQDLRNLLQRIPRWLRPKSANEFIATMDVAKL